MGDGSISVSAVETGDDALQVGRGALDIIALGHLHLVLDLRVRRGRLGGVEVDVLFLEVLDDQIRCPDAKQNVNEDAQYQRIDPKESEPRAFFRRRFHGSRCAH
jgi:hypothetical protein